MTARQHSEPTHEVALDCARCGRVTEHEVVYAGRILASSTCTVCGMSVRRDSHLLRSSYVRDFEHRLVTKPRRLVRRALRHPGRFLRALPAAVVRQPAKVAEEVRTLLRPRSQGAGDDDSGASSGDAGDPPPDGPGDSAPRG